MLKTDKANKKIYLAELKQLEAQADVVVVENVYKPKTKKQKIKLEEVEEVVGFDVRKEEMDQFEQKLKLLELRIHDVKSDGNCLFHAISHQMKKFNVYIQISELRNLCAEYIQENKGDFLPFMECEFEEYLQKLRTTMWGGNLEIVALSKALKVCIHVHQSDSCSVFNEEYKNVCLISYHLHLFTLGPHYNSLI